VNYQICQMESKWVKTPYGVIREIRRSDQWTITEFPGNFKIIAVKKCREMLPILYEWIVHNNPEVVEYKLMVKRIQIHKK